MHTIQLERLIALPREIVWEALVDPVLVEGWLHPVERLIEGTSQRLFIEPESAADARLEVISPVFGQVSIRLSARPGGPRDESTLFQLEVSDEWGREAARTRLWRLRLDQLDELLRGYPVDWQQWSNEHAAEHLAAIDESSHRTAR